MSYTIGIADAVAELDRFDAILDVLEGVGLAASV